MNARRLFDWLLILVLGCLALLPMSGAASNYGWTFAPAPDFLSPANTWDNVASDSDGRVYVLIRELHDSVTRMQVRDTSGLWSSSLATTIPVSFVMDRFVTNPNSGKPVALGVEPAVPSGSLLVAYEYSGLGWTRTVITAGATGYGSAFDYDSSGILHFVYRDAASNRLYYGQFGVITTTQEISTLFGTTFSEWDVQASKTTPGYAAVSAYDPSGFVLSVATANNGANWSTVSFVDAGYTSVSSQGPALRTVIDSSDRLHLFYRVETGGAWHLRYRSLTSSGSLSDIDIKDFGAFLWDVLLKDDIPHLIYRNSSLRAIVEHREEGAWFIDSPDPGRLLANTIGAEVVGGQLLVLTQEHATFDLFLYVGEHGGITPPMFNSGFE